MGYKIIDEWQLVDFYPEDYLEEVSDKALIDELNRRKIQKEAKQLKLSLVEQVQNLNKMQLHDFLADVAGVTHPSDNETILNELKYMI